MADDDINDYDDINEDDQEVDDFEDDDIQEDLDEEEEEEESTQLDDGEDIEPINPDIDADNEIETEISEDLISVSDLADIRQILHNRQKILSCPPKIANRLSKYELASIIGYRAQQIAEGAHPYIVVPEGSDPITIAIDEFNQNLIPLVIERPFPTNKIGKFKYETFKLDELINVTQIK